MSLFYLVVGLVELACAISLVGLVIWLVLTVRPDLHPRTWVKDRK